MRAAAGWLLTLGLVLGLAAAMVPSLRPVWNARPPEQLLLIATRTGAWIASSLLFAAGLVAALYGVFIFGDLLLTGQASAAAWIGVASFTVGTTLWLIHLGYRLTVMVSVSRDSQEAPTCRTGCCPAGI